MTWNGTARIWRGSGSPSRVSAVSRAMFGVSARRMIAASGSARRWLTGVRIARRSSVPRRHPGEGHAAPPAGERPTAGCERGARRHAVWGPWRTAAHFGGPDPMRQGRHGAKRGRAAKGARQPRAPFTPATASTRRGAAPSGLRQAAPRPALRALPFIRFTGARAAHRRRVAQAPRAAAMAAADSPSAPSTASVSAPAPATSRASGITAAPSTAMGIGGARKPPPPGSAEA